MGFGPPCWGRGLGGGGGRHLVEGEGRAVAGRSGQRGFLPVALLVSLLRWWGRCPVCSGLCRVLQQRQGVSRTRPGAICPPALPELSCCSLQRFQGGSPLLPASTAEVKSEHLRVENSYIKINKMVPRVFIWLRDLSILVQSVHFNGFIS